MGYRRQHLYRHHLKRRTTTACKGMPDCNGKVRRGWMFCGQQNNNIRGHTVELRQHFLQVAFPRWEVDVVSLPHMTLWRVNVGKDKSVDKMFFVLWIYYVYAFLMRHSQAVNVCSFFLIPLLAACVTRDGQIKLHVHGMLHLLPMKRQNPDLAAKTRIIGLGEHVLYCLQRPPSSARRRSRYYN